METGKDMPLEVRLSAYMDGQLDAQDTRQVEAELAADSQARELLEQLKAGSTLGNQAFDALLKEPVPLTLVRAIKAPSAASGGTSLHAANTNTVSFLRFIPQAIAASAVLLIAGGYTGYFVGSRQADVSSEISEISAFKAPDAGEAKTRGMGNLTFDETSAEPVAVQAPGGDDTVAAEIAGVHKVYVSDKMHLDEVPAGRRDELVSYLEAVTSVSFRIPDLSAEGYSLRGGKLAFAKGLPTGALIYENDLGAIAGVYFMENTAVSGQTSETDGFAVIAGQKGDASYFVAAPDDTVARKLETGVKAAL